MADTYLDIVDDHDVVTGTALRSEIHAKGLLHREVHVWFITPDQQVIFQKRSLNKLVDPGLFGCAVGGHVEMGKSYIEAAFLETKEETGLNIQSDQIIFLEKYQGTKTDLTKNIHDHAFRALYGFVYTGPIDALNVEEHEGAGFAAVPFNDLLTTDVLNKYPIAPELYEAFIIAKDKLRALVIG